MIIPGWDVWVGKPPYASNPISASFINAKYHEGFKFDGYLVTNVLNTFIGFSNKESFEKMHTLVKAGIRN